MNGMSETVHPVSGQCVEIRRPDKTVAMAGQRFAPMIVRNHEDDVHFCRFLSPLHLRSTGNTH